ncbi:hypothetical protein Tco_1060954 [Tanacetum coccineum]
MSQMQKVPHERPQCALPSNTEPYPREQVNSITTRSGLTTVEPFIPPPVPPTPRVEVEKEPETLMDKVHITSPASTAHVPPPGIQPVSPPKPKEDPMPNPHQPKIMYPSRLNKTKLLDKNDVQVTDIQKRTKNKPKRAKPSTKWKEREKSKSKSTQKVNKSKPKTKPKKS